MRVQRKGIDDKDSPQMVSSKCRIRGASYAEFVKIIWGTKEHPISFISAAVAKTRQEKAAELNH